VTPVDRSHLLEPVDELAPRLLGAHLQAGGVTVRLTEVEAYAGEADPGSHAFRGRTPRTQVMYGPPGHAYVYFTYGMHWCLNVVTGPQDVASAVLLRAGEVVDGHELAAARRPGVRERDLCRGPARLCRTTGITGALDGTDLLAPGSALQLLAGEPVDPARVRRGPRVGVAGAGALTPWRFWLDGEATVSPYRPAVRRVRRRA
jgi:DNA-3-methyladenine glycosylase